MKTKILVIGRQEQILDVLFRLINQHQDWEANSTSNDEEAIRLFQQEKFDLVLLSSGIPEDSESRLRSAFRFHDPQVVIIQHYGGGSGLLTGEILQALENKNKRAL